MHKLFYLLLIFIITACGGGGGGSDGPTAPPEGNAAPTIESIADQSVNEGETIEISVSASDSDGSIASYAWTQTSGPEAVLTNTDTDTVTVAAPNVSVDSNIVLTVTVTDDEGATASTTVNLNVKNIAVVKGYSVSPHPNNFRNDQDLTDFYAFFDHINLNQIEVRITQAEWDAFLAELAIDLNSDKYFKSNVTITTARGSTDIVETGIRIRGNTTRQIPENGGEFKPVHFKLKFNETFDMADNTLPYIERQERRFANLRAINLKNRRPGYDDSQMRELYAYDLFNQVGIKAPLTGSARLTLVIGNTRVDYGIYTAIEPIDKTFLRKRYGDFDNEGNLYKCLWQRGGPAVLKPKKPEVAQSDWIGVSDALGFSPTYDLKTNESTPNFTDMTSFINQLDALSGDSLKTYLDANFEVDEFLRFLATNVLIGMPDDYWAMGNNYYLYFNNNGKVAFIPYDYDNAFGEGWTPFNTAEVDIYNWENLSGPLSGDSYYDDHPLVDKILAIDSYRAQYESYLAQYTDPDNGNFNFANYTAKFNLLKALYDPDNNNRIDSDIPDNVPWMNNDQQTYIDTKISSVRRQLGL